MSSVVCTLFEGHYHLGVGALINSLHASGFKGRMICGLRGPEPTWAEDARKLRDGIEVTFVQVGTDAHFSNYKPQFLKTCWEEKYPDAKQLYYFDPDIVIKAPWSVIDRWAADGIAVCEDVNGYLPARHPYRLSWNDFLEENNFPPVRPLDRYYNAGFIGMPREHRSLLDIWTRLVACSERVLGSSALMKFDRPGALFHSADQDALNMALSVIDSPINGTGPEGMDFTTGGHLLSHAIGGRKPWRGGFLGDALRGRPPGSAQKSYFRFAESPLRLFPAGQLARLRLSLRSGALLGRMYRRA